MGRRHYRVTWEDALRAHEEALLDGGRAGLLNENAVRSALARPYHGYHRRIWQKAAALMHGVVRNHGFVDAKKRTSLYLAELLIERSGYRLDADDMAIVETVVAVADGNMSQNELAQWFRTRLVRKPGP